MSLLCCVHMYTILVLWRSTFQTLTGVPVNVTCQTCQGVYTTTAVPGMVQRRLFCFWKIGGDYTVVLSLLSGGRAVRYRRRLRSSSLPTVQLLYTVGVVPSTSDRPVIFFLFCIFFFSRFVLLLRSTVLEHTHAVLCAPCFFLSIKHRRHSDLAAQLVAGLGLSVVPPAGGGSRASRGGGASGDEEWEEEQEEQEEGEEGRSGGARFGGGGVERDGGVRELTKAIRKEERTGKSAEKVGFDGLSVAATGI